MLTPPPPRLALVIHSLCGGGAERVLAQLANHWAEKGVEVTLITLDDVARDRYPLDERVKRIGLGLLSDSKSGWMALRNNVTRLRTLRRTIQETKASTVVSFTDKMNITTLLATVGLPVKVIAAERSDPRHQNLGRTWEFLRQRLYGRAQTLVVQTNVVRDWAKGRWPKLSITVIANPVPELFGAEVTSNGYGGASCQQEHRLVAVGRLSREKGFDLLIDAWRQIAVSHPTWTLRICGDGPERERLATQVNQAGLGERTTFLGWVAEPVQELRAANAFVLPSRYEGFPNALLEAMAIGLPCVSFDCDAGPREIIRPDVDGLLVPAEDSAALAETLDRLLRDEPLRLRLGKRALEVCQRFSRDEFFRQWDSLVAP